LAAKDAESEGVKRNENEELKTEKWERGQRVHISLSISSRNQPCTTSRDSNSLLYHHKRGHPQQRYQMQDGEAKKVDNFRLKSCYVSKTAQDEGHELRQDFG